LANYIVDNHKVPKTKKQDPYFDYDLIEEIKDMSCASIDELMTYLGVDYRKNGKMIVGPCPVHGGDNLSAWNLYPEGEEVRGYWVCRTHHCEKKKSSNDRLLYGSTIIGFVRGVLSNQKGTHVSYKTAIDLLLDFLGYESIKEINKPTSETLERRKYASSMKKLSLSPKQKDSGWSREKLISTLEIPSKYYIDRGYSRDVLDKYDVGLYNKRNRTVVPVYDDNYKYVAGFLGRSVWGQCNSCKKWHDPQKACPKTSYEIKECEKWLNGSFQSTNYLYNYWFAAEKIRECGTAILVEGAGDVWRLEENGIHIGLALFGTDLTDAQRILLDRSGAMSLIVLLDPDDAGRDGCEKLKSQLGRQYRMYFPKINDDVGGLNSDEITSEIKPIIERAC
jgi:5S rRNA maturation endonuclease (ribonuclease M5)